MTVEIIPRNVFFVIFLKNKNTAIHKPTKTNPFKKRINKGFVIGNNKR